MKLLFRVNLAASMAAGLNATTPTQIITIDPANLGPAQRENIAKRMTTANPWQSPHTPVVKLRWDDHSGATYLPDGDPEKNLIIASSPDLEGLLAAIEAEETELQKRAEVREEARQESLKRKEAAVVEFVQLAQTEPWKLLRICNMPNGADPREHVKTKACFSRIELDREPEGLMNHPMAQEARAMVQNEASRLESLRLQATKDREEAEAQAKRNALDKLIPFMTEGEKKTHARGKLAIETVIPRLNMQALQEFAGLLSGLHKPNNYTAKPVVGLGHHKSQTRTNWQPDWLPAIEAAEKITGVPLENVQCYDAGGDIYLNTSISVPWKEERVSVHILFTEEEN